MKKNGSWSRSNQSREGGFSEATRVSFSVAMDLLLTPSEHVFAML
jgi:hypothetical protein